MLYVCQIENNAIKVDYLARQYKGYKNWVIGNVDDEQPVNLVQAVSIDVAGDWNFRNDRHSVVAAVMMRISNCMR